MKFSTAASVMILEDRGLGNSTAPEQTAREQSDQCLHSLPFCLHLLDA